jgi:hypothetical protein
VKQVVCVEKLNDLARGHLDSTIPRRATPLIGSRLPTDAIAEGLQDVQAVVGRSIINDNNFDGRIGLLQRAFDCLADERSPVVTGDHDCHQRLSHELIGKVGGTTPFVN